MNTARSHQKKMGHKSVRAVTITMVRKASSYEP